MIHARRRQVYRPDLSEVEAQVQVRVPVAQVPEVQVEAVHHAPVQVVVAVVVQVKERGKK